MRISADWLSNPNVQTIMSLLSDAGHQVFFVGGCVRNALLSAPASDIDITTDAHPNRVLELAARDGIRAVPTGINHGTVTLIVSGEPFEVTTFRRDVETDGRRAVVAFADNIEDDALRRDFTINALYADATGLVHDPLNGLPDLKARRVRFIEDPTQRIAEDYLRILRFFRFHAWYGDQSKGFDSESLAACASGIEGLATLSKERIGAELIKLLSAPEPQFAIAAMAQTGILNSIIGGADHTTLAPLIHIESDRAPSWYRRLAALGGQDLQDALRLSKNDARIVEHTREVAGSPMSPEQAAYQFGPQVALDGYLVRAASLSQPVSPALDDQIERGSSHVFPINSEDLVGEFKGKALGAELGRLKEAWIASGFILTREQLLQDSL